jgi:hypothetical protein
MPTLLIMMIVGAAAFFFFSSARGAAERAAEIGRDACHVAGVQWLDESVHAIGDSDDGQNRRIGRVVLQGQRLVGFSGPSRAAQAVVQVFPLQ